MVQFDQSFFEDEIRDGWLVKSDMKQMWAAGIEILMEIDRLCRKYGIPYFADFGTLLGAVRHNGYIPWDDDLDIVMFRDDYMKFLRVADELEYPIMYNDIYRSERWTQPFARIGNGAGISLDQRFLKRFHGCPYAEGVDVFILDDMLECEEEFYLIKALDRWACVLKAAIRKREEEKEKVEKEEKGEKKEEIEKEGMAEEKEEKRKLMTEEEIEDYICQFEEVSCMKINREKNIVNQLLRIIDGLGALNAGNQNDKVFDWCFMRHDNFFYVGNKREWYRETIYLPFENIEIPVPIDYDQVLKQEFGNYLKGVKIFAHDTYAILEKELRTVKKDVRSMKERLGNLENILEKG